MAAGRIIQPDGPRCMIQQVQVGGRWTDDRYKDDECVGRESVVWILCCSLCLPLQMARKVIQKQQFSNMQ